MSKPDQQKGRQAHHCSFCGKHRDQVDRLIAGPNVFICDACVRLCNDILDREATPTR